VIALGLNMVSQVLAVRFLSKSDFGAYAFAVSVTTLGATISALGLDKAAARFLPFYREHGDNRRILGALALMLWTILALGGGIIAAVHIRNGALTDTMPHDPLAASLLLILVILAPVGALDTLLISLSAVFSGARTIFFRRHLLAPILKLLATVAIIGMGGSVRSLAWATVVTGVLGTAIFAFTLARVLRRQGVLEHWRHWRQSVPARQIYSFATPMFGSDMVFILRTVLVVFMLEHFRGALDVAAYQAVVPAGRLNLLVRQSFEYLFVPLAARLHARDQHQAIEHLHAHTTTWVAVLSFPIFIVFFSLAEPVTVLLFGERYADSAPILSILSLGQFLNAVTGTSALTMRVFGKVRVLVAIDAIVTVVSLPLYMFLIPRFGAIGAAIATGITLFVHSILNVVCVYWTTGIGLKRGGQRRLYASLGVTTGSLALVRVFLAPPLYVSVVLAVGLVLFVVGANRHVLDIANTFPQAMRFGIVRRLFAARSAE
jgi:O-antigen/teichoic acid export membrane protein